MRKSAREIEHPMFKRVRATKRDIFVIQRGANPEKSQDAYALFGVKNFNVFERRLPFPPAIPAGQ
jgi:hypothetical protein